jgi:Tol biopolymer transport system component
VFYASLSPDGSTLAFTTVGPNGGIWVRDLSTLTSTLLPETQNVIGLTWAPDSRSIAFGRAYDLFRVDLVLLCQIREFVRGSATKHDPRTCTLS